MTNSPTSLLDFIRRRVSVGELVRRRVDWLPFRAPPVLNLSFVNQLFFCFYVRKIYAFDSDRKRLAVMQTLMKKAGVECVTMTNCSFLEVSNPRLLNN